jgi:multidrug resistance efflux pump
MLTKTQSPESAESTQPETLPIPKRMIRLRPTESLGERFPAMHLVRSSWFARTLSRLMFIFLIGLVFAAIFLPWQQTSRCDGEVVARLPQLRRQVVQSGAKGIIKYIKPDIREGSKVHEGEVIMELEALSKEAIALTQQQERLLMTNVEFSKQLVKGSKAQVITEKENLKRLLESIDAEIESKIAKWQQTLAEELGKERSLEQARLELTAAEGLRRSIVPEIDYQSLRTKEKIAFQDLVKAQQAAEEAYKDLKSKESLRQSKQSEVDTKIIELDQKVAKAESDVAKFEKELSEIRVKLGELERLEIKSPSDGIIQAILGQVGTNAVKEGDKLFEVIPDTSDLAVELNVRGLDLPLISVGDSVRLQFDGWPAIQFVGWPSVAVGTFGGKVIAINPADDIKGLFKIIVGPDPEDPEQEKWPDSRYLRQGVRANAWVILDTVPLGFEIWRQLNGIPPSKSEPGESKAKDPKLPKFK